MTLQELLKEISTLPTDDQRRLIDMVRRNLGDAEPEQRQHSLRQLRGLGKEIWQHIDTKQYLNEQRDEWDQPR